jgi:outer membrane protein assembly factor BamA
LSLWALVVAAGAATTTSVPEESWWQRKFVDPEDGRLDASGFLESAYGFVPLASIITDPAVGYGASLGLIFIRPAAPVEGEPQRPDLSALAGFATNNGSWGAGIGDSSLWRNGTLKTLAAAFDADVNLQLFDEQAGDDPLAYRLRTWGAFGEGRTKLGDGTSTWFGLRYVYASVRASFADADSAPERDAAGRDQVLSGLTPLISYDTRDNLFTPRRGLFGEAALAIFDEALGSERNFQLLTLSGMLYRPTTDELIFGVKADLNASFDAAPFYLRPYVQLRGIQSLQLQGRRVANVEAELRWQHWERYSLVAFAGAGAAWNDELDDARSVATGGVGVRYLAARRFGLHVGCDVGFGPDEAILYFQFGSAWFRP